MHIFMNEDKLKRGLRKYRAKSFYKKYLGYSVFPAKSLDDSKLDGFISKYQVYSKNNTNVKISNLSNFVGKEHVYHYDDFFLSNNMMNSSLISDYAKNHSMRVNVFIESEKFLTQDELDLLLQEYADNNDHLKYLQGDDRKKLVALEAEWLNIQREHKLDLEKFYSINFAVIKNINDNDGKYGTFYLNNDGSIGEDYIFKDSILESKKYIFNLADAEYIAKKCLDKDINADVVKLEDLNENKNLDLQHANLPYNHDYNNESAKQFYVNKKYRVNNFSIDYLRSYLKEI